MGELKPGWRRVKFGEVVHLVSDRCDPVSAGITRFVGLEHLEPGDLQIRSWGSVADGTTFTNRFQPGHVLFGKRRAYQRKVAIAEFEGVCSGDIYVLESSAPERFLPELLAFICQTDAFFEHAVGTSAGSLSPRTNWTSLAEYEFTLPPLEEQSRIRNLLTAIEATDRAITLMKQKALSARDAYATQVFLSGNHCPSTPLHEVCDEITVGIVVKPAQWYVNEAEGVPALLMKNVQRGWLDLADLTHISHEGHRTHEKSTLRQGNVVVVRSSGSAGRTGDAAVVPASLDGANCIDLLIARPGSRLAPEYLCEYLNAPATRGQLVASSSGTMQKHLNVGAFRLLHLPLRSLDEQMRIVTELRALSEAARKADDRRSALKPLRECAFRALLHGEA